MKTFVEISMKFEKEKKLWHLKKYHKGLKKLRYLEWKLLVKVKEIKFNKEFYSLWMSVIAKYNDTRKVWNQNSD